MDKINDTEPPADKDTPTEEGDLECRSLLADLVQLRKYEIKRYENGLEQYMASEIGRLRMEAKLEICRQHLKQLLQVSDITANAHGQPTRPKGSSNG